MSFLEDNERNRNIRLVNGLLDLKQSINQSKRLINHTAETTWCLAFFSLVLCSQRPSPTLSRLRPPGIQSGFPSRLGDKASTALNPGRARIEPETSAVRNSSR